MPAPVYRDMLDVMLKRGGSFAGADVPEFYALMEELFTPEEALVNNALPREPVTAAELAKRMGRDEAEIRSLLETMANKGVCVTYMQGEERVYLGAPFMLGIFEYQFLGGGKTERERRIAALIHDYKKAYLAAKGGPKPGFPLTRVITVDRKIRAGNRIHTYDQVASYIDKYDTIGVGACFCRHTAGLRGEDIHGMPTDVCMWFGTKAEYTVERLGSRKVSKKEAREVLDRAEEAGLLHMSRNTSDEIEFLCNCDRWHCDVVTQILKYPKPGLVFNSGFSPRVDEGKCTSCGVCIERCPSGVLSMGQADTPECNLDRCFGCAVCASGCPADAIEMEARPDWPEPPKTMKELVTAIKGGR
jgi:Pyruvate/2-oxoacid:ferredoxin oxidoreductase delta subunit